MENKKIGIITFHTPISFGAHFQCLALQLYLRKQGYDAEVIDYSMRGYLEYRTKHKLISFIARAIKVLPLIFQRVKTQSLELEKRGLMKPFADALIERDKKFLVFRNQYYHMSSQSYTGCMQIKSNPPCYDAYICGSDQIWNPNFCDSDDNYFLAFAPRDKRIAYAPSFGVSSIPWIYRTKYKVRLNAIPYLSVREVTGQKIIKQITGRDVPVVIDPTLLISREDWTEISEQSYLKLPDHYILTYFIGIDKYIHDSIHKTKSFFHGLEVINLVFDQSSYGPCDFLKLISHADFVLTNSFHGMVFCINFEVPFMVCKSNKDIGKTSGFSRMEDLLVSLGLEDRILDVTHELHNECLQIDYEKVSRLRNSLYNQSATFLKSSIDNVFKKSSKIMNKN